MPIELMRAHEYMQHVVQHSLGRVVLRTKGSTRAVYLATLLLARHEEGDLVCDASHAQIAALAGVDRQTEVRATKNLERAGVIAIEGDPSERKPLRRVLL